jgi:hypothetical protein
MIEFGDGPRRAKMLRADLVNAALAYPSLPGGEALGQTAARRSSQAANWPGVRTPSSSTAV